MHKFIKLNNRKLNYISNDYGNTQVTLLKKKKIRAFLNHFIVDDFAFN